MFPRCQLSPWFCLVTLGLSHCSSAGGGSAGGESSPQFETRSDREGPSFFDTGTPRSPAVPTQTPLTTQIASLSPQEPEPRSSNDIGVDSACVITEAEATLSRQAVDIILLLDNSGSMADELQAAEDNINRNFASILASRQVDYRVILISRHRRTLRAESGESSTSVCITSPLSALSNCDEAREPVFGERFFHYSTKIESDDSFDVLLDTYEPPFASDREDRGDNAPQGWSEWLRPGAKKVIVEMTDDNEDMSSAEFLQELTALAPEHFGANADAPNFVFHSIVGLAEKNDPLAAYTSDDPLQIERCEGGGNNVDNAGEVYQELSILTDGLRFPLCQFDAYDVVFQQIAEDVVFRTPIACDFPIPEAPAGATLDLDNVAIAYSLPGDATAFRLAQAPDSSLCASDAFFISDTRLTLCPSACQALQQEPEVQLDVLFTCESQLVAPR